MFYVEVQQVDYDDYPIGKPDNIGPFQTKDEAADYLEKSEAFRKKYYAKDYFVWTTARYNANYTVCVRDVAGMFIQPGTRGY